MTKYIFVSNDGFSLCPEGEEQYNQQVIDYIIADSMDEAIAEFQENRKNGHYCTYEHMECYELQGKYADCSEYEED